MLTLIVFKIELQGFPLGSLGSPKSFTIWRGILKNLCIKSTYDAYTCNTIYCRFLNNSISACMDAMLLLILYWVTVLVYINKLKYFWVTVLVYILIYIWRPKSKIP